MEAVAKSAIPVNFGTIDLFAIPSEALLPPLLSNSPNIWRRESTDDPELPNPIERARGESEPARSRSRDSRDPGAEDGQAPAPRIGEIPESTEELAKIPFSSPSESEEENPCAFWRFREQRERESDKVGVDESRAPEEE